MSICRYILLIFLLSLPSCSLRSGVTPDAPDPEATLLTNIRQLTFEGKRSGEGYFSADGEALIFQSERDASNPFYQMYRFNFVAGTLDRLSPGYGKTTCGWINPDGERALFSSTHLDPEARRKQQKELEFRASGKERRYAWDYDEEFEIFERSPGGSFKNLTGVRGYDAEASYSPDGSMIAFASNRLAYSEKLSVEEREKFERDPSYLIDLYLMNSDGSDPRQLTSSRGYDGGPFFSADGKKICWRRFSEDGATAEIFTMDTDGSNKRQITHLSAMSWAPFFHPSGEYLIFATNLHGFKNFELYIVDASGEREPVRVTHTDGFDGLPAFSPDGRILTWTSKRKTDSSQIFLADWNHEEARSLLDLGRAPRSDPRDAPVDVLARERLRSDITYLASDELEGRMTGTVGEQKATAYAASELKKAGFIPAGDDSSYFQDFSFVAGVSLGENNQLRFNSIDYEPGIDWTPLSLSRTGEVESVAIVFAGYGIKAPGKGEFSEYDSYVHLDAKDKWVLVFRYLPEDISAEHRQHLARYSGLRYKAMVARDQGAKGLIVVSGPNAKVKHELVRLAFDTSLAGTSIGAISVTNSLAAEFLAVSGRDLKKLQDTLDSGDVVMGFEIGSSLGVTIDLIQEKRKGRNVLARLNAGSSASGSAIVAGAHIDHLGRGGEGSLARSDEKGRIHPGADDNASGVAGALEIARTIASMKRAGKIKMKRDLIIALWSGEELGILGSNHFVKSFGEGAIYPGVAANVNMDMIGRLDDALILQGIGSSAVWKGLIERGNLTTDLSITLQNDTYLPTDATPFYLRGVPILSAFTGAHGEYHSPRDTIDTLNFEGTTRIVKFLERIVQALLERKDPPGYLKVAPTEQRRGASLRAYLGTIPDYSESGVRGVKLSGASPGGPAEKAGVRSGDIVVSLAGRQIENIYDYTYAIEALKIGEEVKIGIVRAGARIELSVIPGSRD